MTLGTRSGDQQSCYTPLPGPAPGNQMETLMPRLGALALVRQI
jgi:hypothetical protein